MLNKLLRNRKTIPKAPKASQETPYLIHTVEGAKKSFVFGLNWQVVLGDKPEKATRQLARKNKTDFYVRPSGQSNTAGLLKLAKNQEAFGRGEELHSFAAVLSKMLSNRAFAARYEMPNGTWFMLSYNGAVQEGSDCFYKDSQEVEQLLADYKKRWPDLIVYGDQQGDKEIPEVIMLLNQCDSSTRLRHTSLTLSTAPRPVVVGACLLLAYICYHVGSERWTQYQRTQWQKKQAALTIDPVKGWKGLIDKWEGNTKVLGEYGLESWKSVLVGIPAYIGRWELTSLQCNSVGSCSGNYWRQPLGTLNSFHEFKPANWTFQIDGYDQINVFFDLPVYSQPLKDFGLATLPKIEQQKEHEINMVQKIMPVVNELSFSSASLVNVGVLKQTMADGSSTNVPFPASSGLIRPYSASYSISMPLRSLSAVDITPLHSIDQIIVKRMNGSEFNKKSSWFQLQLSGTYYVQE